MNANRENRERSGQEDEGLPGAAARHLRRSVSDESGVALVLVILVMAAVMAITVASFTVQSNAEMIHRYTNRQGNLQAAARAGIEDTRSRLNSVDSIYPDSGYVQLEDSARVYRVGREGNLQAIPGVRRWTWVGPTGITTGQYGVFGSIVVRVKDATGSELIRRQQIRQESFSKFAYFTSIEPSSIAFGGGDQIFGPVHSNDEVKIYSSGATFHDEVTTSRYVDGEQYATFEEGYKEYVDSIPMPKTAELSDLQSQAQDGNTAFSGNTSAGTGEATTRIEFITIDLNGDGKTTGANEGFMRVYQSSDGGWVTGDVPSDYMSCGWWSCSIDEGLENSEVCGHYHSDSTFVAAADHPADGHDWQTAVTDSERRCFLGGSDSLTNGFQATDAHGQWVDWSGSVPSAVSGRADAQYLIPLSRSMNPDFKGVIHVDGDVAVSGEVRGRITLAATGDIVIADDVTYATDPGAGSCTDMLGFFAGGDVIVADNTLNAPKQPYSGGSWLTYDDTKDEFIHGVVLTLNQFTVENYSDPSSWAAEQAEPCESTPWGRGCLYLTGGIIQRSRGPVGESDGSGYLKRYSYDACAASDPPPYYPTTGRFTRGTYYEIDPTGFSVSQLFDRLTPSGSS